MGTPDLGLASVPVFDQAQVRTELATSALSILPGLKGHCSVCLQLPRSCQTFKCRTDGREQTIYVVGTAHTSSASCDDVRAVIREVKPEVCYWQNSALSALTTPQLWHHLHLLTGCDAGAMR